MMLVDAHCHADEYSIDRLKYFIERYNMVIVGVGMDYASSLKILEYSKQLSNFIPCVGIHPWNIGKISDDELDNIIQISTEVKCLGEIGLDTRFAGDTIDKQRVIFQRFLEIAPERNLILNIHSVDTWKEILDLLIKYDIKGAVFHWYSGPQNLLREIASEGYFITINPAVKFQKKHRRVLEAAPLEILLTESDGPYLYRGVNLSPELIPETLREIAAVKEIDVKEIVKIIYNNFRRLFHWTK